MDASDGMFQAVRVHPAPNLEFRRTPIEETDSVAEFNVCFSTAAIHWLRDHCGLLTGAHRALMDAGWCLRNSAGDGGPVLFLAALPPDLQELRSATR